MRSHRSCEIVGRLVADATTTGAVIANAVFDAIGVRMLRLPMTADRVRQAIQRGSDTRA